MGKGILLKAELNLSRSENSRLSEELARAKIAKVRLTQCGLRKAVTVTVLTVMFRPRLLAR